MGTWAEGSFENDKALDWLDELFEKPQEEFLRSTLEQVTRKPKDEHSTGDEVNAVAAADIVACWLGHAPPEPRRFELVNWARQNLKLAPETVALAKDVVRTIKADSQLKELWRSEHSEPKWHHAMDNLEERLQRGARD
jgi:hypothetical protein